MNLSWSDKIVLRHRVLNRSRVPTFQLGQTSYGLIGHVILAGWSWKLLVMGEIKRLIVFRYILCVSAEELLLERARLCRTRPRNWDMSSTFVRYAWWGYLVKFYMVQLIVMWVILSNFLYIWLTKWMFPKLVTSTDDMV